MLIDAVETPMPVRDMPNSPERLAPLVADGRIPRSRIWLMLVLRSAFSLTLLLTVAGVASLMGTDDAVRSSAAWWLWYVTIVNILTVYLLAHFAQAEGMRLRDIYNARRDTWKGDLLWLIGGLVVTAVVAQVPSTWLAGLLWADSNTPNSMLIQALPLAAVYPLFLLMPTIHALAELPLYWGYVAPRLRAGGMKWWAAILVVGAFLSLQHLCFSFQLDWRYDLWLGVKFLPFALWTGYLLYRRPTVLPYMMAVHFALDATLPLLVLMVSQGRSLAM